MKGACPKSPSTSATHCMHSFGPTYSSYPAQWDERCCHCGAVERVRQALPTPPPGCGPFHPDAPTGGAFGGGMVTGGSTTTFATPDLKGNP